MFVFLSHRLDPAAVCWPGTPPLEITPVKQLGKEGRPNNTYTYRVSNHCGSHMDAPAHFTGRPITLSDLPERYFGYTGKEVCLLELPKGPGECIDAPDLQPHAARIAACRLLLVRTGIEALRDTEPETYQQRGPYVTEAAAKWLNQTFENLDCLGLDCISLGCPTGVGATEAHRWLLGYHTDHFTCIAEDMRLSALGNHKICSITLGPARVVGTDSGQVSAMAWLEDKTKK